jgi:hypothetical protein
MATAGEIDNICFAVLLGERARGRVEELGRMELTDQEARWLVHSKAVYLPVIVATQLAGIAILGTGGGKSWSPSLPFIMFAVAGCIIAAIRGGPWIQVAKGVGTAVLAAVLGMVSCFTLGGASHS